MKKNEISQTSEKQAQLIERLHWFCTKIMCLEEDPGSVHLNLVADMVKVYFGSDEFANLPKGRREILAERIAPLITILEATDRLHDLLFDEELVDTTFESIREMDLDIINIPKLL